MKARHHELLQYIKENRKVATYSPFKQLPFFKALKIKYFLMFRPDDSILAAYKATINETLKLINEFVINFKYESDEDIKDVENFLYVDLNITKNDLYPENKYSFNYFIFWFVMFFNHYSIIRNLNTWLIYTLDQMIEEKLSEL